MVSIRPLISQSFGDCTKNTNYDWWKRCSHVPQFISIIIIIVREFSTPASVDGLSLKPEWQQVSLNLPDPTQYSRRSKQYGSFDGLVTSSNIQLLQSPYKSFAESFECSNYNWNHRHFHVLLLCLVLWQDLSTCLAFHLLLLVSFISIIICLHTAIWYLVSCLKDFTYRSIWPRNGSLICITTSG